MPLHVRESVTNPGVPTWSPPIATGNAWVRSGNAWVPVRSMHTRTGNAWELAYAGPAPIPPVLPQGTLSVNGSMGVGDVRLTFSNRSSQWRVRGTQTLFDNGVVVQSFTVDELADVLVQPMLGISTTGEVVWDVYFYEPLGPLDGPTRTFSIFF